MAEKQEQFKARKKAEFEQFIASRPQGELVHGTGKFSWYEAAIRRCYYTARHHPGWLSPTGFFAAVGFVLLVIPLGLYYKATGKKAPDLELI